MASSSSPFQTSPTGLNTFTLNENFDVIDHSSENHLSQESLSQQSHMDTALARNNRRNQSQAQNSPNFLLLLDHLGFELGHSTLEMIMCELHRDQLGLPGALNQKAFASILPKCHYEYAYEGGDTFLVTTSKTDSSLVPRSFQAICGCLSSVAQVQNTAFGLQVPSTSDLHKQGHSGVLIIRFQQPLPSDDIVIQMESVGGAAAPSHAIVIRMPEYYDDQASLIHHWYRCESSQDSTAGFSSSDTVARQISIAPPWRSHRVSLGAPPNNEITVSSGLSCATKMPVTPCLRSDQPSLGDQAPVQIPVNESGSSMEASSAHTSDTTISSNGASPPGSGRVSSPFESRGAEELLKTFLVITAQAVLTLVAVVYSASTSLSSNAKILLRFAVACNTLGFFACLSGIIQSKRNPGVATRIIIAIGYVATAFGFLAIVGLVLPDKLKLWITGITCVACLPVLFSAFRSEYLSA